MKQKEVCLGLGVMVGGKSGAGGQGCRQVTLAGRPKGCLGDLEKP